MASAYGWSTMAASGGRKVRLRMAVLILVAACAGASEHRVADLVLVAETRPTGWDFSYRGESVRRSGSDESDRAWAAGLGARWGWGRPGMPHHLLAGADALWVEETFGDGGKRGALGRVEAGYGYGLSDRVLLTVLPSFGAGAASLRMPGGVAGSSALAGRQVEAGIRAGARCRIGERWVVAVEAGWLHGWEAYRDGTTSVDIERDGPWTGLSIGYLAETAARSLE